MNGFRALRTPARVATLRSVLAGAATVAALVILAVSATDVVSKRFRATQPGRTDLITETVAVGR